MTALEDARAALEDNSVGWSPRRDNALLALIAEHERLIGWQDKQDEIALMMEVQRSSETPSDLKVPSDDPSPVVSTPPTDDESIEQTARRLDPAVSNAHATLFPPTGDEREVQANQYAWTHGDSQTRADFLAGWDAARRQGPITDAQVEAAKAQYDRCQAVAICEHRLFNAMRCALEAARAVS